jgi:hypothetical protein
MAVRLSDWLRIKRSLSSISEPLPKLQIAYSLMLGFSFSQLAQTLEGFSTGLLSSTIIVYALATLFSFLSAVAFVVADMKVRSERGCQIKAVVADMTDVEGLFETAKASLARDLSPTSCSP